MLTSTNFLPFFIYDKKLTHRKVRLKEGCHVMCGLSQRSRLSEELPQTIFATSETHLLLDVFLRVIEMYFFVKQKCIPIFATNHLSSIRPFSISDPSSAIIYLLYIFTIYKVYFLPIVEIYYFLVTFIFPSHHFCIFFYCRNIFPSCHFNIFFLLQKYISSCHFHTVVARVFKMNCNTSLKKFLIFLCSFVFYHFAFYDP